MKTLHALSPTGFKRDTAGNIWISHEDMECPVHEDGHCLRYHDAGSRHECVDTFLGTDLSDEYVDYCECQRCYDLYPEWKHYGRWTDDNSVRNTDFCFGCSDEDHPTMPV